ncbi:MAG: helix-turn-helix transcriptional regulator [Lentisphaerae bacterium]|nr:helix-turn-helix transcriptional regulator [Lentisphaerota bacterium]
MKKRPITAVFGTSKILGFDYGKYPLHDFISFAYAGKETNGHPFKLLAAGNDYWHRECLRQRINSNVFAIEFVCEGTFLFKQFNKTTRIKAGEIFLVQLGENNSIRCETETASKRTVTMAGTLLRRILEQFGLDQISRVRLTDQQRFDELFDELQQYGEEQTLSSYRKGCATCYAMLHELSAQCAAMVRPPELQRALEYIHENLSDKLSIDKLVRHTGTSSATLHRMFKKYLHASPISYYLDQKMEKAFSLLHANIYSVKEIAAKLKYSSPQYFATEFKKKYGNSPKNYFSSKNA